MPGQCLQNLYSNCIQINKNHNKYSVQHNHGFSNRLPAKKSPSGLSSHHSSPCHNKHLAKPYLSVHHYTPGAPVTQCNLDTSTSVSHPAQYGRTSTSVPTQSVNNYQHQNQDVVQTASNLVTSALHQLISHRAGNQL